MGPAGFEPILFLSDLVAIQLIELIFPGAISVELKQKKIRKHGLGVFVSKKIVRNILKMGVN